MIRFDDLPSDPLLLKQKLIETTLTIEKVSAEKIAMADERNVAIAQRDAALQENEKLLLILSQYKRALFGRRSEKVDADQLQFLLSGNEPSIVADAANENAAADGTGSDTKAGAPDNPPRPRPNRNRGMLPIHLPRVDVVIDVASKICPCCGGSLHKIGETVKEMFDVVPVQYRVKRMVRPRYGQALEITAGHWRAPAVRPAAKGRLDEHSRQIQRQNKIAAKSFRPLTGKTSPSRTSWHRDAGG